jgi:hypothetical protein
MHSSSSKTELTPANQVVPRERTSSGAMSTEASSSVASEIMEPLVVKDRPTARRYGSMAPEVPVEAANSDVLVSDQVLVSAIANLSTAVRRGSRALLHWAEFLTDGVHCSTTWPSSTTRS